MMDENQACGLTHLKKARQQNGGIATLDSQDIRHACKIVNFLQVGTVCEVVLRIEDNWGTSNGHIKFRKNWMHGAISGFEFDSKTTGKISMDELDGKLYIAWETGGVGIPCGGLGNITVVYKE